MIDANITLNQLTNSNNGARRLITMIGAKNLAKAENSVSFKFMRGAKNKANYCKITFNVMDTYDLEFGKIHGLNYKVISEISGLYDDQLFSYFQDETKLNLSL